VGVARCASRPSRVRRRPELELLEGRVVPALVTWTGASPTDNNWSDPLNWSPQQVPGPSDTAYFTEQGVSNYQVNVSPSSPVGALTADSTWGINGGTLNINAALSVTGNFEMDSGNLIEGTGSVSIGGSNSMWTGGLIDLASGGLLNTGNLHVVTGNPNNRVLAQVGTLTNQGTIYLDGRGELDIRDNATLNNSGTIDFTGDGSVTELFGGTLTNTGTVEKTGGTGTSSINATLTNNGGALNAASGTLAIAGPSTLIDGATLDASSGATLNLVGGGTVDYTGTMTGSGLGTVALNGNTLAVTSAGATFNMPNSLLQWTGGTIDVSSGGTLTNASTGELNLGGTNLTLTGAGTLANQGTINAAGVSNLILTNSAALHNSSLATFDFTSDSKVTTDGNHTGGPFTNDGVLEKTGGTGTSAIISAFNNNGAGITVQKGTLAVDSVSGLINGGTFTVSASAILNLTGSVQAVDYAGTFTGSGSGTVALSQGTLAVTSAGATFNLPGSLFQWTGGTIDVLSGNLTNAGTITIAGTQDVNVSGAGSLINNKSINQTSTGHLVLENNATLNNTSKGTYSLAGNGSIAVSGTGTFLNAGTLRKSSGTGTSFITAPLNNTGTVQVLSGTLNITGAVTQVSSNTLTAGTWIVSHSATSNSTLDISSAGALTTIGTKARVTLSGLNTTFTNLSGLSTILGGGSFTLAGGQSFTTSRALTNNGSMTLGAASVLTVQGTFTEAPTGKLTVQIGGTNSSPTFGGIVSTGAVALGGSLTVTSTVVPALQTAFTILMDNSGSPVSGTFATINGNTSSTFPVKVGSTTMTFQINYQGAGNSVIITRIA
jgi:hypothetical protein